MTPSNTMSPHERVARVMNAMDTPHACEHCGSTFFYPAEFRQYASGHYSSAPGGDLHPLGGMPQVILICICGWPKSPNIGGIRGGHTASGEIRSFLDSLKRAQAYLSQDPASGLRAEVLTTLDQKLGQATADLAIKADVDALGVQCKTVTDGIMADLANLGAKVDEVTQAVTAPPAAETVKAQPTKAGGKKSEPGA